MEKTFNARIYSQGAIMAASEIKPGENDYYSDKHNALEAVKRIVREDQHAIGGEVIRLLPNGHYRTVATFMA